MHAFRHQRHKVPKCVVRRGRLRIATVGLHFDRMNEVGELHRVLDEKNRHIVADQIEVPLPGMEFGRETTHIARQIARTGTTGNSRKTHKDRCFVTDTLQKIGPGVLAQRLRDFEEPVGAGTTRVDDPLGNTLVVKVRDLFPENKVFLQSRPTRGRLQRILIIGNDHTLVCRQQGASGRLLLMQLAAGAGSTGVLGLRKSGLGPRHLKFSYRLWSAAASAGKSCR